MTLSCFIDRWPDLYLFGLFFFFLDAISFRSDQSIEEKLLPDQPTDRPTNGRSVYISDLFPQVLFLPLSRHSHVCEDRNVFWGLLTKTRQNLLLGFFCYVFVSIVFDMAKQIYDAYDKQLYT